jgi:hypothetical protein
MTDDEKRTNLAKLLTNIDDIRLQFCRTMNDPLIQASLTPAIREAWNTSVECMRIAEKESKREIERLSPADPVARAERAEAEVARLKSASVAETQRFIDEVEHHQKTADVAMRRTLSAEEKLAAMTQERDEWITCAREQTVALKTKVKSLRALCGEAAELMAETRTHGCLVPGESIRSMSDMATRLREAAKEVKT